MARSEAIIDIRADPFTARAERRRALLRIGVPIAGVVLMIAVILIIALQLNYANRRGALELADDVLAANDSRIKEQVTSYFAIPLRALEEGLTIGAHEPAGERRRSLIETFSIAAMNHVPQIADFIIGDSAGEFMMLRRGDNGGIDTKFIQNEPGPRKVIWIRRNAAGQEIGHEEDPSDTFDPRTRPWYSGALASNGIFWTDVYVFYTANQPGITASTRYLSPEGRNFVVGVDITLASLSEFLGNLEIGKSGRAMIIGHQGRVIAYPREGSIVKQGVSGPVMARVDEIGDAAAAGAYDRFRVDGPGRETITVDGHRYLTALTPLQVVGRDWSVMTIVPEKDFIGFVERNARIGLVMSLAIVAIAMLMAGLLVLQGLRGDRAARLVHDRSRAMTRQSEALELVANEADEFNPSRPEPPQALTETAAEITGARRTSLWYLASDGSVLHCADSFDSETSCHTHGSDLHCNELPHCFEHITAGSAIDTEDAAHDPRTAEIHRLVMAPLGSRALSIVPMRRQGHVVGTIWLEDAAEIGGARHCLRVLAGMAALRADVSTRDPHGAEVEAVAAVTEPDAVRSFAAGLSLHGVDAAALGDTLYPDVAVFVMRLDEEALAANGSAGSPELLDAITCAMQEIAAERDIAYLKLVGYDIIGAAGFAPDDPTAASRIASIAVAGRDRLFTLFEASGRAPDFRLGIDYGSAIGRSVGNNPRVFNLWGGAVRGAQIMAVSALPATIQATEAAYLRLRRGFLLRPRGTFYMPLMGTARTFILAGRL